jgi:o-succinylbenzoate---CoA ligase
MPKGSELLRQDCARWERGASILLLNPRSAPSIRDRVLSSVFPDLADHVWLATSGTSGACKVVALSRDALECSAQAVNQHLAAGSNDVWLNALPVFHVGGLGIVARAHLAGSRCEFFDGPWDPRRFVEMAQGCVATLSALVPTQVHDLITAGLCAPRSLRAVVVGGGALPESMRLRAADLGWALLPSYGLTEAASQVATASLGRADCGWLPLLPHAQARVGEGGVLELRGASLLTGWIVFDSDGFAHWEDPKRDGWFRTSDRAELRGRELRFSGRADDLVKIRGELVDIFSLEQALRDRVPAGIVALFADLDDRAGSVLRLRAENAEALAQAREALDLFPPYARPAMFEIGLVGRTALGKVIRPRP